RQDGQGVHVPPGARHPVDAAAGGRHRGVTPPDAASGGRDLALHLRAVRRQRAATAVVEHCGAGAGRGHPDPSRGSAVGPARRPAGAPHRAPVVPAGGDAGAAPRPPRGPMVNPQPATPSGSPADAVAAARAAAAAVVDPELRVVTIEELGILRDVRVESGTGRVTVTITPTYSGCPAMEVIRRDILA